MEKGKWIHSKYGHISMDLRWGFKIEIERNTDESDVYKLIVNGYESENKFAEIRDVIGYAIELANKMIQDWSKLLNEQTDEV